MQGCVALACVEMAPRGASEAMHNSRRQRQRVNVKGPRGHSPSPSASGKENGERRRRSREGISIVSICQMAHSKFGSLSIWQIGTRAASAVRPQAPANPGGRRVSEIQKLGHSLST